MKTFFLIIISLFSVLISWVNIKLYTENLTSEEKETDILLQLNFLEREMKGNLLATEMQEIFPEGYVFSNALYGLSWCELALAAPENKTLRSKALAEALYAYDKMGTKQATGTFDPFLQPEYGIFYTGWNNYLLSKILALDTPFTDRDTYTKLYKTQCDSIISALQNARSPFLQSYFKQSWPADMFVAMASVSNHDKLFTPRYQEEIDNWLSDVKQNLDPVTGMVPHKTDMLTGAVIQGARGCSMTLILRMLGEIDPEFGKQQFQLFEEHFIETTFGLPSVREYPKDQFGVGDVDSGPVIFGVGFTATIVSIGPLAMYENSVLSDHQYQIINAFGFESQDSKQKSYLLGALPMADLFIAWGRASSLHYSKKNTVKHPVNLWVKFHFISLFFVSLLWGFFYRKRIIGYIKKF